MKRFACGAVVPDCDAVFEADTEEEILRDVSRHAAQAHGMPDVSPDVIAQVRAAIRDA